MTLVFFMKDINFLHQKYLVDTYPNRGLNIVRGNGVYLYTDRDEKYLDLMANYGVNIFGHSHPVITKALTDQLPTLVTLHGSFVNDQRSLAAEMLVNRCGGGLSQVYFSNSGAEAVESALKFAVLATGKKKFISCHHAYHGKTLGALSAIGTEKYKAPFQPLLWNFQSIPFNDTDALSNIIDDQTAAFIVEPVQGEGGILVPSPEYLKKVRTICDAHGVLLIIDEIQTGIGRTGAFLASSVSNISYDILCLGKGLAGGMPVGATLVSPKVAAKIPRNSHTSTFGGNPLTCAGIIASLNLLDDVMLEHVRSVGEYFISELQSISSSYIKEVRGKGLMIGIDVGEKRNDILKKLQTEHILAIPAGESTVRFLPAFIIKKEQIDSVIEILNKILV